MKKYIYMVTALVAMAFTLASCSGDDMLAGGNAATFSPNNFKVNITVSEAGSDDVTSRAIVKTGWADGDQIKIWYDSNTQDNPDLVIKYNSTAFQWEQDASASVSGNSPSASGTLKAVYSAGDYSVIVAAKSISYTYVNSTFTAYINSWKFLTQIQVVVSGLTSSEASQYSLGCSNLTPCTGYTVSESEIKASSGLKGATTQGISNADGVAFVFCTTDYDATSYKFHLFKQGASVPQQYTASSQLTAISSYAKINPVKITSTKFSNADHDYVNIGGLNIATMNLGATTVAGSTTTCYGLYYAWGETTGYKSTEDHSFTSTNYQASSISTNLSGTTDAATVAWGSPWRMPTVDEIKNKLIKGCSGSSNNVTKATLSTSNPAGGAYEITAEQTYLPAYSGVDGVLLVDKGNTNMKLFLPYAGYLSNTKTSTGANQSYYLLSTYNSTTDKAYVIQLDNNGSVKTSTKTRYEGYPIRAVTD